LNNDIPLSILLGALILFLIISAFFAGSETALMSLNRYRLQHLVKQKHIGAIKAHKLLQRPDRLISLILLGNCFANTLASSLATVIAIRLAGEEAIPAAAAILTLAMLIFSEVTPKTLAAIKPEVIAFPSAWVHILLMKIVYPIVWIVNVCSNLLLRIVGVQIAHGHHHASLNKDELRSILVDADRLIPQRYQKMLMGILDLESATVEDVMTPRNEITGIDLEDSIESIIQQIQHSPHTRLPVYKKSIDRVIGFLHLRIVLSQISHKDFDKQKITDHLLKPFFIPASTSLHEQMQSFKAEKLRIGLVVDEYGDVQGLVTLDDLLQEIVGELINEEIDVKKQADGSYLVDASVTVRDLNRITHWDLPTEGPKTLNGLIIEIMENIPKSGTSLKLYGYVVEILNADDKTIKLVKFYPPQ
jgi:Mg2+/Co2+ transporter CorB